MNYVQIFGNVFQMMMMMNMMKMNIILLNKFNNFDKNMINVEVKLNVNMIRSHL